MKFDIYPNPVDSYQAQKAKIKILINTNEIKSPLSVQVFDLLGREISRWHRSEIDSGGHYNLFQDSENHNSASIVSGIYFVRVAVNSTVEHRKLVVLR